MKRLSFIVLSFLFIVGTSFGQEDPAKALKKAKKALGSYNLAPADNANKLEEAVNMIDIASADATLAGQAGTWIVKGEVYGSIAQAEVQTLVKDPAFVPEKPEAGIAALNAYKKGLELAEKKYEKKDAVTGISQAAKNLNFIGNAQIQAKDYAGAYKTLSTVLNNIDVIVENGGESPVAAEEVDNQKYIVAFCADIAGEKEESAKLFKDLYDAEYPDAGVYSKYFNILSAEGKADEALKVLEKGREKFPDDSEILFTEINYYIQREQYDVLEVKLKEAIAKEPDNPSIYSALGNVYMNLYTEDFSANGDTEQGTGYFNSALEYFQKAVDLNPKAVDAIYSIGSLYFNKAVELIKVQNDLGMTKAEMKRFDEIKVEVDGLFEQSLPYFKKAESLDPNDSNTLIALSEIFARTQDFDKNKEFKARLEKVKAGGSNEKSYFDK